jgi:hypothetical protein
MTVGSVCLGIARRKPTMAGGEHGRAELREEEDLDGQLAEVRAARTPRFILAALLANYPELLSGTLQSKHLKHVLKAAEERAMHAIRELWSKMGCRFTPT